MRPQQTTGPSRFGPYTLYARIGADALGESHLAGTSSGLRVAVRVLRPDVAADPGIRQRLRSDVTAASAVAGPHVARLLDADPDADPPWLAHELVEAPTLAEVVATHGPLPLTSLHRLGREVADALVAMHAVGVTHRTLGPSTVLLAPAGAKVIDFGIAPPFDPDHLPAAVPGAPRMGLVAEFPAPEQIGGRSVAVVGPAADVFALGATLAFASTGVSPFVPRDPGVGVPPVDLAQRIAATEPDLAGVPPAVAGIVRTCLEPNPLHRPTAMALSAALDASPSPGAAPPAAPVAESGGRVQPPWSSLNGAPPWGPPSHGSPAPRGRLASKPRRRSMIALGVATAVLIPIAVVVALVLSIGSLGAADPVPGLAAGAPPASDDPRLRYLNRLCTAGSLFANTRAIELPVVRAGDYVDGPRYAHLLTLQIDRDIGMVQMAVVDFGVLRDEAPTVELNRTFATATDELAAARDDLRAARLSAVGTPITAETMTTALQQHYAATRRLSYTTTLMDDATLPDDYRAVRPFATECSS